MLRDCGKMIVIPPTTNQWPQTHYIDDDDDDDDDKVSMGSSDRVMEKPAGEKQQAALKCPRCDSSNTKFCYYNNYSLSQPRYFCKACKRYWTRGGTLRNVPVGGGYRKNKRVKKPTTSSSIHTSSAPSSSSNPSSQPRIDIASTSNHMINPLFYGLPGNSCDVNLHFSTLNSRVSSSGYDLQPQLNALGLGISSGMIMSCEASDNGYRNGFTSNNALLSSYSNPMLNSSSTSTSTTPVLFSTLLQQKFINGTSGVKEGPGSNTFQGLAPLEQLQMASNYGSEAGMVALKDVKVEEGRNNRLEWNGVCQSQMEHVGMSDPSLYWNTATGMAAWNDQPNNIGPSVTNSLI